MEEKVALRQSFLAMRESLSDDMRRTLSARIVYWLEEVLLSFDSLMGYWPVRGEVDIVPLMEKWRQQGRRLFLPRIKGKEMEIVEVYDLQKDVARGRFGILEPLGKAVSVVPLVILVPGVVFDKRGFRIGFGGGFYDRFLSKMKGTETIGVAYSFQIVERIPCDRHDFPVSRLVCERGWIK